MADECAKFTCYRCGQSSGLTRPVLDDSGMRMDIESAQRTRIYRCERCQTENEVIRTAAVWRAIDSEQYEGCGEVRAAIPAGRAPIDESAQRDRLERSLDTVRTASAAIGAAALAAAGVLATVNKTEGPTVLRVAALVIAIVVVLVGLGNVVPLRQTPQPADKIAQLRNTLTVRYRVVLGSAVGLAVAIGLLLALLLI